MDAQRARFEALFKRSYGRILPSLIRRAGDFGHAEDALQQSFEAAWKVWPLQGWPERPEAWLQQVAGRRLLDGVRRRGLAPREASEESGARTSEATQAGGAGSMVAIDEALGGEDDSLRLIFTCCHPALARESQVALTLNSLCGLTAAEIGVAFLVSTRTMAQRLVRVKSKIRSAGIPFRVPPVHLLRERLECVMSVFYLVFSTGYSAPSGPTLMRFDLCAEAIRLTRMLLETLPDEPELRGLLALMLLQHGRAAARCDERGRPVLLEHQERSRWDHACLEEGQQALLAALRQGQPGSYQLQAAIAGVHSAAQSYEQTDWLQIRMLYDRLLKECPSPVVELNRAVAVAMTEGVEAGLACVERLASDGRLEQYVFLHSTRADFLQRLGRDTAAGLAWRRALELAENEIQRDFLRGRLGALEDGASGA